MKQLGFILLLFIGFSLLFSCGPTEPDVFSGVWIEKRNPETSWEITRSGRTFKGKRLTGEDKYEYDSESWTRGKEGKFQDKNKSISVLNPVMEGGSKITYFQDRDMIIRLPPGTTYIRKK